MPADPAQAGVQPAAAQPAAVATTVAVTALQTLYLAEGKPPVRPGATVSVPASVAAQLKKINAACDPTDAAAHLGTRIVNPANGSVRR